MNIILAVVIVLFILATSFLVIKLHFERKRISEMRNIISSILEGQKKRQIFTKKEDELGKLAKEGKYIPIIKGLYEIDQSTPG